MVDRRAGRPDVPRGDTYPEPLQPPADAVRGLQVSRGNILQDLFLERYVRNQSFEPGVLFLQILHPLGLLNL